jgi:hypothetical protein
MPTEQLRFNRVYDADGFRGIQVITPSGNVLVGIDRKSAREFLEGFLDPSKLPGFKACGVCGGYHKTFKQTDGEKSAEFMACPKMPNGSWVLVEPPRILFASEFYLGG